MTDDFEVEVGEGEGPGIDDAVEPADTSPETEDPEGDEPGVLPIDDEVGEED